MVSGLNKFALHDLDGNDLDLGQGNPEINSNYFIYKDQCFWWDLSSGVRGDEGAMQLFNSYEFQEYYSDQELVYGNYKESRLSTPAKNYLHVKSANKTPTVEDINKVLKFFPEAGDLSWNYRQISIDEIKSGFANFIFVISPDGRVAKKDFETEGRGSHGELAKSLGARYDEDEIDENEHGYVRGIVNSSMFFAVMGAAVEFTREQADKIIEMISENFIESMEDIVIEDGNGEFTIESLVSMIEEFKSYLDIEEKEPDFEFNPGCWVEIVGTDSTGDRWFGELCMILELDFQNKEYVLYQDTRSFVAPEEFVVYRLPMEDQKLFTFMEYDSERLIEFGRNAKQSSVLSPVQETLDEQIWNGERLKPEVKNFCLQFVNDFLMHFVEEEEVFALLKRVYLIGSITGYQYDPDADLDINILVDLDALSEILDVEKELLIYEMRRKVGEINGKRYPGTEHPANIFLSTEEGFPPADGIYDLFTDVWLKKPGHPGDIDPYSNLVNAINRAEEIAEKVDAKWGALMRIYQEIARYPKSELAIKRQLIRVLRSLKRILKNVVTERRESFEIAKMNDQPAPQTGVPNIVYKYLEYNGLLDKLHEADHWLRAYDETGVVPEIVSEASVRLSEATEMKNRGMVRVGTSEELRNDSSGSDRKFSIDDIVTLRFEKPFNDNLVNSERGCWTFEQDENGDWMAGEQID